MDVVNRGLSGWNTNNVLKYMDDIFHQPNLTTPKIKYLVSAIRRSLELRLATRE